MEFVISARTEDRSLMPCFLLTLSKINSTAPPFLMPCVSSLIPSRFIRQYSVFYVMCQSSARYVSATNTVCNNIYVLTLMLMVFSYTHLHIYLLLYILLYFLSLFSYTVLCCIVLYCIDLHVLLCVISIATGTDVNTFKSVPVSVTCVVISHSVCCYTWLVSILSAGCFLLWVM
jgi:hypothetical protein